MTLVKIEDVLNHIPPRATTLRTAIEQLPAIRDAVCVVRCRNCRYYSTTRRTYSATGFCVYHTDDYRKPHYVVESDFCSCGKRKV